MAHPSPRIVVIFLIVASAAIALLTWWTMSHGPGISPDSAIYIGTARNLLAGHGVAFDGTPMNHFPPLYPLMLAALGFVTGDTVLAAKVLAAVGFGVNIALVGAIACVVSGGRLRAMLLAIPLFAVSGPVIYLHTMAWSEAPFYCFALCGLVALAVWTVHGHMRLLIAAAGLFALAMMTRYVGIVLLAPLAAAVLLMRPRPWMRRIGDLFIAGALAFGPLAGWMLRNAIVSPSATDRALVSHPINATQLMELTTTLDDYLLPISAGPWFKVAFAIVVALLLVLGLLAARRQRVTGTDSTSLASPLVLLMGVFVASYVGFLLLSVSFIDATTPFDDRILFPVFGMVIVATPILADTLARHLQRPGIWWTVAAAGAVSLAVRVSPALAGINAVHDEGVGYLSDTWHDSEMLEQVRQMRPDVAIYSNAQDAIEFLTGRVTQWLPEEEIWERMQPNPAFDGSRAMICQLVRDGKAIVAYFTTDDPGDEWAINHTREMCDFPVVTRHEDGAFYSDEPSANKSGAP